jgi:malonate decarboxylase beta subunit
VNNLKTFNEIREGSFYEAGARERAKYLLDEGSFHELASPNLGLTSPHLPALGEAVSFDDGVVTAVGAINSRPVFVISQEGRFIGGAVGEVGGAKIAGVFRLALELYDKANAKYPGKTEKLPAIVYSFETGGVRLHEANAGLLAHAEIMEWIQKCRGKVPVFSLVGSKVGCFGGMGFVCVATDAVIMSSLGRIGLTGPEVIEQEMGKSEFDSSDRALVYRTTGGRHKYIMRDCAFLVDDSITAFRNQLADLLKKPYEELSEYRVIGNYDLVQKQLALVKLTAEMKPKDSRDLWAYFGNREPNRIPEMETAEFLQSAVRAGLES